MKDETFEFECIYLRASVCDQCVIFVSFEILKKKLEKKKNGRKKI